MPDVADIPGADGTVAGITGPNLEDVGDIPVALTANAAKV
jgi:hypothetical protein